MKSWIKRMLPAKVDFHVPEEVLGLNLTGEHLKQFENLKALVKRLYADPTADPALLLQITDYWLEIRDRNQFERYFMPVLKEFTYFLRLNLLSSDPNIYSRTILVLDTLIKNSDYVAYSLIGKKRMLQTLSISARRNRLKNNYEMQVAASFAIDCIQAWGEAFTSRAHLYPNYALVYRKLREKHHIRFPRPDFDPTRVPIFLGPITRREDEFARYQQAHDRDSEDGFSTLSPGGGYPAEEWEQDWDSNGAHYTSKGGMEEEMKEEYAKLPSPTKGSSKPLPPVPPSKTATASKQKTAGGDDLLSFDELDLLGGSDDTTTSNSGSHASHQALFPVLPPQSQALQAQGWQAQGWQSQSQQGWQQQQSSSTFARPPVLHYQPQPPSLQAVQQLQLQPYQSSQQAIAASSSLPSMRPPLPPRQPSSMLLGKMQGSSIGSGSSLPVYAPPPPPPPPPPPAPVPQTPPLSAPFQGGTQWASQEGGHYYTPPVSISSFDIHKKPSSNYHPAVADHVLSHYDTVSSSGVGNSSSINPFDNDSIYYNNTSTANTVNRATGGVTTMRSLGDEIDSLLKDQLTRVNTMPAPLLPAPPAVPAVSPAGQEGSVVAMEQDQKQQKQQTLLAAAQSASSVSSSSVLPSQAPVVGPTSGIISVSGDGRVQQQDGAGGVDEGSMQQPALQQAIQQCTSDDDSFFFPSEPPPPPVPSVTHTQAVEEQGGTTGVKWQRQMIEQNLQQQRLKGNNASSSIGVDHNVDIKFYGPQRVVLRK